MQVLGGVGLTALLHLLQVVFSFTFAFILIGLTQLVYMVPAGAVAFATGHKGIGYGLVIGAAITALINAACFLIVLYAFSTGH